MHWFLKAIKKISGILASCFLFAPTAFGESLSFALPKERTAELNPLRPALVNMTRDSMLFYLRALTSESFPIETTHSEHQDIARLDVRFVHEAVIGSLREAATEARYIEVMQALKDIVQSRVYRDIRHLNRRESFVPESLAAFAESFPFLTWDRIIIPVSLVKGRTRIIYCGRGSPRISVAQTHFSTTGDPHSPVRETEIIIEREDGSSDWDFFVYDARGLLTGESEFTSGNGSVVSATAPMVCASCHYHPETRRFQNRPLTYGRIDYPQRLAAPDCDSSAS